MTKGIFLYREDSRYEDRPWAVYQFPPQYLSRAEQNKDPMVADADTGFGGLLNVERTVRGYETAGAAGIQIEVGCDDPELDADRLRQLRDGIPDGAWFEINAGGRLDFSSAVWLGVTGTDEFGEVVAEQVRGPQDRTEERRRPGTVRLVERDEGALQHRARALRVVWRREPRPWTEGARAALRTGEARERSVRAVGASSRRRSGAGSGRAAHAA